MKKKVNYLNNKDMLKEIHKSKTSFCYFEDNKYAMFDAIIVQDTFDPDEAKHEAAEEVPRPTKSISYDIALITPEIIQTAKEARAKRLTLDAVNAYLIDNPTGVKKDVSKILPEDISDDELVFRIISYDHIPFQPGRKKRPKTIADTRIKLNFHPFKHYVLAGDELREVGRSHWKDGKFSLDHGAITDKLARMFMMLVQRYSQRANWRGYTYVDEMKGQALMQLSQMGLQFNEHKSDNPFAYYTAAVSNAFTRVLNTEKVHQGIRDDLLEKQGQTASFTRQLAHEEAIRKLREDHDVTNDTK